MVRLVLIIKKCYISTYLLLDRHEYMTYPVRDKTKPIRADLGRDFGIYLQPSNVFRDFYEVLKELCDEMKAQK